MTESFIRHKHTIIAAAIAALVTGILMSRVFAL